MLQRVYKSPPHVALAPDIPSNNANFFPHNWSSRVNVETAFFTDITESAGSVAEERRSLRSSPGRVITAQFTALNKQDSALLINACLRLADQMNVFPLYSDVATVTAESSGHVLWCDPRFKRFFPLQLVLIAQWSGSRLVAYAYEYVSTVLEDKLIISELAQTVPVGAKVYPMMSIEPRLEITPTLLTDDKITVTVQALEAIGTHTLPPVADDDPVELDYLQWHEDYPVFKFSVDWTESLQVKVLRPGQQYGQGRDQIVDLAGTRPKFGFEFKHTFLNRSDFWDYLRFAESRRGRLRPFWVINPQTYFTVLNLLGNELTVRPVGGSDTDWTDFYTHVALVKTDGTVFISELVSIDTETPSVLKLIMADAAGFDEDSVRRATFAHLCRYQSDALQESWDTDGVVQVSSNIVEVLQEVDAEIDGDFPDPIA